MKFVDIILVIIANIGFVMNQVFVKIWLNKHQIEIYPFRLNLFKKLLTLEIFFACISFIIATYLWIILLKRIELSILAPLVSISYVFALIASKIFFNENITTIRLIAVIIIIVGSILLSKS